MVDLQFDYYLVICLYRYYNSHLHTCCKTDLLVSPAIHDLSFANVTGSSPDLGVLSMSSLWIINKRP